MPMLSKRNLYALHRWIGLIVGLQMLAWSVGGLIFSLLDIDTVRGDTDRVHAALPVVTPSEALLTPSQVVSRATDAGLDTSAVARVTLRQRFDRPTYELYDQRGIARCAIDAVTGDVSTAIGEPRAKEIGQRDFTEPVRVRSVELLHGEPPLEFRGGAMPVYRVIVDNAANTHVYIAPVTGKVLKRRNDRWRWFDFFWMLHIMDYRERDSINHWLLTGMAGLAVATSATGLILWWWRAPCRTRWLRRAKRPVG